MKKDIMVCDNCRLEADISGGYAPIEGWYHLSKTHNYMTYGDEPNPDRDFCSFTCLKKALG